MNRSSRFSRRSFLQSAGLSSAFLPLLQANNAHAAGGPKRVVVLCWSNGIRRNDFWPVLGPTQSETDWALPVPKQGPANRPLPEVPVLEPLVKSFRNDMLILGGLDLNSFFESKARPGEMYAGNVNRGDAHKTQGALLTGTGFAQYQPDNAPDKITPRGESIDQYIGRAVATKANLPFKTLTLGGRTQSEWRSCLSYTGPGSLGVTPENNPGNLFKTLFSGRSLGGDTFDKIAASRKSVLDYLGTDLERFGARMGTEDKQRIQNHLTNIRDAERQLSLGAKLSCTAPTAPNMNFTANDAYPAQLKAQMDLLAIALKCDLTRVATFMFENTGGNDITFSWLGQEFTGKGDEYPTRQHHDIAHTMFRSIDGARRYSRVNQWFVEQVAYFVGLLKNTPEGNGSMLDNTAVVVLNTMGLNHQSDGIPCVIIGSCGGYFKTGGRLVRLGEWKTAQSKHPYYWGPGELSTMPNGSLYEPGRGTPGLPHNRLLVSLANAMDVPTATFGDPVYGGELTELRG